MTTRELKAVQILESIYDSVVVLEQYIHQVDNQQRLLSVLIQDTDTKSYKSLVQTTLVCSICEKPNIETKQFKEQTTTKTKEHDNTTSETLEQHDNTAAETLDHGNTAAETLDHGNTASETLDHGNTAAETLDHGNTAAETLDHGNTAAETLDHGNTAAETLDHGNTASETLDHGNTAEKTPAHGNTAAETPDHGKNAAETLDHGNTAADTLEQHGNTAAETPEQHGNTAAETPEHGNTAAETLEHGNTAAETLEPGNTAAETPEHGNTAAETPEHGNTAAETSENGNAAAETSEHGNTAAETLEHSNTEVNMEVNSTGQKERSFSQSLHQSEILLAAIQKIQKKDVVGKNLLSLGYNTISDNSTSQMTSWPGLENSFPNSNASSVLLPAWKTLLSRIGDDLMLELLASKSLFVYSPPSCFIQITGTPIYDIRPFQTGTIRTLKMPHQRDKTNDIKKRNYKRETKRRRKKISVEIEYTTSQLNKQDNTGTLRKTEPQQPIEQSMVSDMEGVLKDGNIDISINVSAGGRKRKAEDMLNADSSKKIKVDSSKGKSSYPETDINYSVHAQSSKSAYRMGKVTDRIDLGNQEVTDRIDLSNQEATDRIDLSNQKVTDRIDLSNQEGTNMMDLSKQYFSDCNQKVKERMDLGNHGHVKNLNNSDTTAVNCTVRTRKRKKKDSRVLSNQQSYPVPFSAHMPVLRRRILYAKNSQERFPKNYILSKRTIESMDAKNVVHDIFENTKVLQNEKCPEEYAQSVTHKGAATTALSSVTPEVTAHLQPLLEKMMSNHKKFRYHTILEHHCPLPGQQTIMKKTENKHGKEMLVNPKAANQVTNCDYKALGSSGQFLKGPIFNRKSKQTLLQSEQKETNINEQEISKDPLSRTEDSTSFTQSLSPEGVMEQSGHKASTPPNSGVPDELRTQTKHKAYTLPNSSVPDELRTQTKNKAPGLLEKHISHRQVFLFVRACVLKVIPTGLWGSKHNQNRFIKSMKTLIGLGKFEKYFLGQIMTNIKVKKCAWLRSVKDNSVRLKYMAHLLFWLLHKYILILIKSHFYVTDTAGYRNRLFYFRKKVWFDLQQQSLQEYIRQGMLEPVSKEEVDKAVAEGQSLGVCQLRFLPKSSDLRPIINLAHKNNKNISINKLLVNLFHVLNYEKTIDPSVIGSTVLGLDDIFQAWRDYVLLRKHNNDTRPLYFVKVDIQGCYDSILPEKLYDIVKRMLPQDEEEYMVRRYVTILLAAGRIKKTFKRQVSPLYEFQPNFTKFVQKKVNSRSLHDAVLVDQVLHQVETPATLLEKLHSHLFFNYIKTSVGHFRQVCGISQGSIISTLLCGLYYAQMEREHIPVTAPDDFLIRQMDDFLFVTPHLKNAIAFLDKAIKGIPEYNCSINKKKTVTNFHSPHQTDVVQLQQDDIFPWCGLLFNMRSLEVAVDYSRYVGLAIRDTVTFDVGYRPGLSLKNKVFKSIKQKCHGIFLDPEINRWEHRVHSLYLMLVVSALCFHSCAKRLPVRGAHTQDLLLSTILELPGYVESCIKARMPAMKVMSLDQIVQPNVTRWLCIHAYETKLLLHKAQYNDILKRLQHHKRKTSKTIKHMVISQLEDVVGEGLPKEFTQVI